MMCSMPVVGVKWTGYWAEKGVKVRRAESGSSAAGGACGWKVDGGLQIAAEREGIILALFGPRPDLVGWRRSWAVLALICSRASATCERQPRPVANHMLNLGANNLELSGRGRTAEAKTVALRWLLWVISRNGARGELGVSASFAGLQVILVRGSVASLIWSSPTVQQQRLERFGSAPPGRFS